MAQRKYEHRHLITRTISTTSADVLYFDSQAGKNKKQRITMYGKLSQDQFFKMVKVSGIVLVVDNLQTESRLYAMTPETFIEHAKEIID